jgi:hypothetical protein
LTILNNIFCHSVYILRYGVLIYEWRNKISVYI